MKQISELLGKLQNDLKSIDNVGIALLEERMTRLEGNVNALKLKKMDKMLSMKEAITFLGCNKNQFELYEFEGLIKSLALPGKPMYSQNQLSKFIESSKK